ncbi:MAG: hypothetical protein EA392_05175 [Cryomorphaceae bacterium]|nr:MAG: hypothetical protein EA392_05175 [Cryomorphaceae bacterium]
MSIAFSNHPTSLKNCALSAQRIILILMAASLLVFKGNTLRATNHHEDSLRKVIDSAQHDTLRIPALFALAKLQTDTAEAFAFLHLARDLAEQASIPLWKAYAKVELADLHRKHGRYAPAINYVEEAIQTLEEFPPGKPIIRAYGIAGQLAWSERSSMKSIYYKRKWVDGLNKPETREQYGKALNNLGVTYKNAALEIKALETLLKALEIAEEFRDSTQIGTTLNNIGNVYKNREEYNEALEVHWRALAIRRNLKEPQALADTYNNIGLVHRKLGHNDSARYYFSESIYIRKPTGEKRRLSYAYNNLGLLMSDEGIPDSALKYLHLSLDLKRTAPGDHRDMGIAYLNLAETYISIGKNDIAYDYLEKSRLAIDGKGYTEIEIARLEALAKYFAQINQHADAYKYILIHNELKDSLNHINLTKNVRDVQASFALEQSQNEINRLEQEQRLKELELQNAELARNTMLIALVAIAVIAMVIMLRSRSISQLNKSLQEANANLQATRVSKEEKETLLKEVHHRVKNNLQIITSLLRLQSENIKDPEVLAQFNESQNRIRSMALVHEELYRSKDFTSINMKDYFTKLANDLIRIYAVRKEIDFRIDTEVEKMGVNTLIPLGLMVNEIITNALKHAFTGNTGLLEIKLRDLGNKDYELVVADNGQGFPEGLEMHELHSLGVELIHTLAEQLDGSVQMDNESGARYTIRFRCQD